MSQVDKIKKAIIDALNGKGVNDNLTLSHLPSNVLYKIQIKDLEDAVNQLEKEGKIRVVKWDNEYNPTYPFQTVVGKP